MSVQTRDGSVELDGQMGIRECTLVVTGMAEVLVGEDDDWRDMETTLELVLNRVDAERLRDELTSWLVRGEL